LQIDAADMREATQHAVYVCIDARPVLDRGGVVDLRIRRTGWSFGVCHGKLAGEISPALCVILKCGQVFGRLVSWFVLLHWYMPSSF
jgi:hypothetical protein